MDKLRVAFEIPLGDRTINSLEQFRDYLKRPEMINVVKESPEQILIDYIATLDEVIRLRNSLLDCDEN